MLVRRELMELIGVAAVAGAILPRPALAASALASNEVAAATRMAQVVRAYDGQGIHRTATVGDDNSAHWLAGELRAIGVDASLESFPVNRIDIGDAYLELGGRQLGGVPLFDADFTSNAGVTGRLGPAGSDADIGLVESGPWESTVHAGQLRAALDGKHKAVVVITNGGRPGLSLINAERFLSPGGVPALQVSSVLAPWLKEQAATGASARLIATSQRHRADALNVVGTLRGTASGAAPMVVMTPRSGWWTCAGERATGIGAWLETARALVAARPARTVHFLASSGHELGYIGLDAYLVPRAELVRQAALWVHFGANIGAGEKIRLQSADLAIQQQAVVALAGQGLRVAQLVPPGVAPGGEAGSIFRRQGRYVSLQGDNALFHNPADRWPEAVDVSLATKQALAFASLAIALAAVS